MQKKINLKLYISAFVITLGIFIFALFSSNFINEKKTEELKTSEDKIAVDILSFETQFDLLKEASCESFTKAPLREELGNLNSKLLFMEQQLGIDNSEVASLKRYYSVLEIKSYLLSKKMNEQCKNNGVYILYFYSTKDCPECVIQEYILRAIKDKYPQIEIYSFDYMLDLPAIETLITLHNVPKTPPIIDINDNLYAPFDNLSAMETVLEPFLNATTTSLKVATTTKIKK
jgi:hypothetical protein